MKPTRKNITNITKKGSRKDVAENTQVEPKAKTLKPEKIDPVCAVVTKYTDNGWRVLRAPKGGVNDIVAQKDRRFHFVQVVTPETIDDPKYHGLSKNTFIQNAFSNGATPIFAHVVTCSCKNSDGTKGTRAKVTFEDVNTAGRVVVGGARAKKKDSVNQT